MKNTKQVNDFCKANNITVNQFYGRETVGYSLYLRNLTAIPEGFNPTVGGSLDLSNLTAIPEGFNPTVGYCLDLRNLTAIPEGFNPTVGGYLDLSGLTSIPEGFNPTVGGYLDLSGLTSIPEGFNPTVGGYLYLRGLTSIPEGFNPTVGGSLDLSGLTSNYIDLNNRILSWKDGKYIYADGIFTEVLSKKGNIYKVKRLGEQKEFYLITDGKSTHCHGDTLKKAKEDFTFKVASERLKNEPILADTIVTIQHYRLITGSCEFGVKSWMESNFDAKQRAKIEKEGIKAKDIVPILKKTNAYGYERFAKLLNF